MTGMTATATVAAPTTTGMSGEGAPVHTTVALAAAHRLTTGAAAPHHTGVVGVEAVALTEYCCLDWEPYCTLGLATPLCSFWFS